MFVKNQNPYNPIKATFSRDVLTKLLGHLQSIVEKRSSMPILLYVKIQFLNEGKAFLTTNGLDISLSGEVEYQGNGVGEVAVPVQTFYDIVRKFHNDSSFTIEFDGSASVSVYTKSSKFSLPWLPSDEFPEFGFEKGD